MNQDRLEKQIKFAIEIDKLKSVLRETLLMDESRRENAAEHSWHVAVLAMLLWEHANDKRIDLLRVLRMLLIHDLVEIDAGDTYCYKEIDDKARLRREQEAAKRIFKILPNDQEKEFRLLWDEFEAKLTRDALLANALDRLQPLLHSYITKGIEWKNNGVTSTQVLERCRPIEEASSLLGDYAYQLIDKAIEKSYLAR